MKYIIAGGGTGGHLNPGLELAKCLKHSGHEVIYIASKTGNDRVIVEKHDRIDFKIMFWSLSGFLREKNIKAIFKNGINIIKLLILFLKSFVLLKKQKPSYVIGTGGYISFPILFIASKLRCKTMILEQNSYPGIANKLLAKHVDKVGVAYEVSKQYLNNETIFYASNPRVHESLKYQDNLQQENYILFVGGSLGAEFINQLAVSYAKETSEKIILIAGSQKDRQEKITKIDNLEIIEYTEDFLEMAAKAQVVITRAGATTLLELVALGQKIVVIPSPNVVANHQVENAKELAKENLLVYQEEAKVTTETLKELINQTKNSKFNKFKGINSLERIIKELND